MRPLLRWAVVLVALLLLAGTEYVVSTFSDLGLSNDNEFTAADDFGASTHRSLRTLPVPPPAGPAPSCAASAPPAPCPRG